MLHAHHRAAVRRFPVQKSGRAQARGLAFERAGHAHAADRAEFLHRQRLAAVGLDDGAGERVLGARLEGSGNLQEVLLVDSWLLNDL